MHDLDAALLEPRPGERLAFAPPRTLIDRETHYCPGCHHGTIQRLTAEALDELRLREKAILAASVGCSAFLYNYLDVDAVESPHGRACAVATGLKRARPDNFVFTYQGDGDLAAIGLNEAIHAANRGERITVVFVNNTIYGMTGGQMAPTTMAGQKTTTCPGGRCPKSDGQPLRMAEMMAQLAGVAYSARVAVDTVAHLRKARKALQAACRAQLEDRGFGFVEFLSTCPTNWKMTPAQANAYVADALIPVFPLGVFKDAEAAACTSM